MTADEHGKQHLLETMWRVVNESPDVRAAAEAVAQAFGLNGERVRVEIGMSARVMRMDGVQEDSGEFSEGDRDFLKALRIQEP